MWPAVPPPVTAILRSPLSFGNRLFYERFSIMNKVRAAVVVLGELGRSPRMLNHARELDRAGFDTVLVGYRKRELDLPTGIRVHPLHPMDRIAEHRSKPVFIAGS